MRAARLRHRPPGRIQATASLVSAAAPMVVAALMTAVAACRGPVAAPPPSRPLVVVGVDGLEWRIVLELAAASRIPALAGLMRAGTFSRLTTLEPALSPPIWTTMATGVLPQRHGILGFVRAEEGRAAQPFTSSDRRVKAIWNIAGDAGISTCVIGYWTTFPAEPIDGVMVAQSGAPPGSAQSRTRKGGLRADLDGQVHPPELSARIFETAARAAGEVRAREQELYGDSSIWPPAMQRLVEHSRWSLEADTAYQAIALELAAEPRRCELLIVYLGLPDVLGHRFWRWTAPADFASPPSADEVASYGEVLRRAYVQVDRFVAELRSRAGGEATFVVASDHGMGAFRAAETVDLTRSEGPLLRTGGHSAARDGFLAAAGPGIAARRQELPASMDVVARSGSVVDVTPTLLALLGLPRGADMDGHTMTPLLDARFAETYAGREIASHTPAGWQAFPGGSVQHDPDAGQRIEQLRGLGYLE